VEPVGDLEDEEELVLETHPGVGVGVVGPHGSRLHEQPFPARV
jgi:hypothetical protein